MKLSKSVLFFLLLLSISGCGGGSDSSTPSDQGTNSSNLPPDPGDAGKATLQGIDSDSDGVRDDVQIAIYERYPNDEPKRNALTQQAKALQEAIISGDSSNSNTINQVSKLVIDAVDCLHEKVGDATSEIGFLEQKVVNTSDRSEAYIKFNEALNGQFFGGDDTNNPCE